MFQGGVEIAMLYLIPSALCDAKLANHRPKHGTFNCEIVLCVVISWNNIANALLEILHILNLISLFSMALMLPTCRQPHLLVLICRLPLADRWRNYVFYPTNSTGNWIKYSTEISVYPWKIIFLGGYLAKYFYYSLWVSESFVSTANKKIRQEF